MHIFLKEVLSLSVVILCMLPHTTFPCRAVDVVQKNRFVRIPWIMTRQGKQRHWKLSTGHRRSCNQETCRICSLISFAVFFLARSTLQTFFSSSDLRTWCGTCGVESSYIVLMEKFRGKRPQRRPRRRWEDVEWISVDEDTDKSQVVVENRSMVKVLLQGKRRRSLLSPSSL